MAQEDDTDGIKILLLDGGLGTTLAETPYKISYNNKSPLWASHLLISSPETLASVHQEFALAGADILLTATYSASYEGFARTPRIDSGLSRHYDKHEATDFMRNAVNILVKAISDPGVAGRTPSVALSLGAYGAILSPSQEYSGIYPLAMAGEDALASWHKERMDIFRSDAEIWKKIDYVAFETVRSISEVRGIRKAAKGVNKKWWISHVVPGEVHDSDILGVVMALLEAEEMLEVPWGIGINCTAVNKIGPVEYQYRTAIKANFPRLVGKIWLILYPDGTRGEVYDTNTMTWVKMSEQEFDGPWEDQVTDVIRNAMESKVWKGIIVGGCCKTSPKDIKRLRSRMDLLEDLQN